MTEKRNSVGNFIKPPYKNTKLPGSPIETPYKFSDLRRNVNSANIDELLVVEAELDKNE